MKKPQGPRVLLIDIETKPLLVNTWGIHEQNIGLNQVREDWAIIAFAAKWLDSDKITYADLRKKKNKLDDKALCEQIWELLDQADIILTQNGIKFDAKKINARMVIHGLKPPSSYRHIDTCKIAKAKFGFTSNSLAYLSKVLGVEVKKSEHKEYPGQDLWTACVYNNDQKAWKVMEDYNKTDILALEGVYHKLKAWDTSIDFNLYHDNEQSSCTACGGSLKMKGFAYTASGKFQRFICKNCGANSRGRVNLLSKEKKQSLRLKIS
jgi:hypothetical protein